MNKYTDNKMYRDAILRKYGIRKCFVSVERLSVGEIPKKNKFLATCKQGSVGLQVSWLPSTKTMTNSATALNVLDEYRKGVQIIHVHKCITGFQLIFSFHFIIIDRHAIENAKP